MTTQTENAVLHAQIAELRGELARLRADRGHLRARLMVLSERDFARGRRGMDALMPTGGTTASGDFPGTVL